MTPNQTPAAAVLRSALERLHWNFKLMLAGKPVRDVSETLAEVEHALKATGAVAVAQPSAERILQFMAPWLVTPADAHDQRDMIAAVRALIAEPSLEQGGLPPYPTGDVVGPCVCGSWPGGRCFRCKIVRGAGPGEPTEPSTDNEGGYVPGACAAKIRARGLDFTKNRSSGAGEQPSELDHVECEECGSYYFCERCGCQTPELIFKARAARAVAVAAVDGREAKGSG